MPLSSGAISAKIINLSISNKYCCTRYERKPFFPYRRTSSNLRSPVCRSHVSTIQHGFLFLGVSHQGTIKFTHSHTANFWFNEDGNAPLQLEGHFNLVGNVDSSDIVYRFDGECAKGKTRFSHTENSKLEAAPPQKKIITNVLDGQ